MKVFMRGEYLWKYDFLNCTEADNRVISCSLQITQGVDIQTTGGSPIRSLFDIPSLRALLSEGARERVRVRVALLSPSK